MNRNKWVRQAGIRTSLGPTSLALAPLLILVGLLLTAKAATQVTLDWTKRAPAMEPSPRFDHAAAYDAARERLILFGGSNPSGGCRGDTWAWDGSTWTQLFPANSPPARLGHQMVYDSGRQQIVLFGGVSGCSGGYLNDTWAWTGSNWEPRISAEVPGARQGHAMAFDSHAGVTVLFGGHRFMSTYYDDTWTFDGRNWTRKSPSQKPTGRSGHAMAFDPVRNETVMFGDATWIDSDTWIWDGSNWTRKILAVHPPGNGPVRNLMTYDRARSTMFLLVHGYQSTWNYSDGSWTQLTPATTPTATLFGALAFDGGHQDVVLIGSEGGANNIMGTWTWQPGEPRGEAQGSGLGVVLHAAHSNAQLK